MCWQRYHQVDGVSPQALVSSQPLGTTSSKSRDPMGACGGERFASLHQVSIAFRGSRLSAASFQALPLSPLSLPWVSVSSHGDFSSCFSLLPMRRTVVILRSAESGPLHASILMNPVGDNLASILRYWALGFYYLFFGGGHIYKQKMLFFLPLRTKHWLILIKEKLPLSIFPALSSVFHNMCIVMHF